jgi:CheY-like chemotaxis protein
VTRFLPILQVEDSDEDVFLLEYAFRRAGILNPVHVATDGQQAIDYLLGRGGFSDRERHPLPGLILLDLKLPMRTGLEVLAWVRQQPELKTLVVIVLSSSINDGDVRRAYELGANAFLVKPSDTNALADMCRALKHFWLTYNQPPLSPPD